MLRYPIIDRINKKRNIFHLFPQAIVKKSAKFGRKLFNANPIRLIDGQGRLLLPF